MKEVVITIYAAIYFQQYIFEVIVGHRFVLVKKKLLIVLATFNV